MGCCRSCVRAPRHRRFPLDDAVRHRDRDRDGGHLPARSGHSPLVAPPPPLRPADLRVVAGLAIAFPRADRQGLDQVLFSGQDALGPLIADADSWSLSALALLIVFKGVAYAISLAALAAADVSGDVPRRAAGLMAVPTWLDSTHPRRRRRNRRRDGRRTATSALLGGARDRADGRGRARGRAAGDRRRRRRLPRRQLDRSAPRSARARRRGRGGARMTGASNQRRVG